VQTARQIVVPGGGSALPQALDTAASPTFVGVTLSGLTAGSVVYAGTAGVLSQDNANLFWDSTNHWLGIGTTVPGRVLHAVSQTANADLITNERYSTGTTGATYTGRKARGTLASPLRAKLNDVVTGVGGIAAHAASDVAAATFPATLIGQFRFFCAEDQTTTNHGGYFTLQTCPVGSTVLTQRLRVDDTGFTVNPTGNTSAQGYCIFTNKINATGTDYTQTNAQILALTGTGPNPAGTGLTVANYFNPNLYYSVTDGTNQKDVFSVGAEGNWTFAGGFPSGAYGFYIFDQVAVKTALTIGYATPVNNVSIGAAGSGNEYNLYLYGALRVLNGKTLSGLYGTPGLLATGRSTAAAAAVASVSTYTNTAVDGSFEVSANVLVTTATTHAFNVECAYTDEGNTARVLTLSFTLVAGGAFVTSVANGNGAVPYMGIPQTIRVKASTTITIRTQAAGVYTTVAYNVEGFIKQVA
jgi:hypothetical protein